jgi:hypothetical protein
MNYSLTSPQAPNMWQYGHGRPQANIQVPVRQFSLPRPHEATLAGGGVDYQLTPRQSSDGTFAVDIHTIPKQRGEKSYFKGLITFNREGKLDIPVQKTVIDSEGATRILYDGQHHLPSASIYGEAIPMHRQSLNRIFGDASRAVHDLIHNLNVAGLSKAARELK